MNCRRVNSLLSAYLDSELTGAEMFAIREHLRCCGSCREEHEALSQTKRLVSSLSLKAPRAELEALLLREADAAQQPGISPLQWLPSWISDRIEGFRESEPASPLPLASPVPFSRGSILRVKPLAATAVLSVAGFCLASATVDGPSTIPAPSAEVADLFSVAAAPPPPNSAQVSSSELRELRTFAAENVRPAALAPVEYSAAVVPSVSPSVSTASMTSAAVFTAPSPSRLLSSPASLSVTEGASPTIWQAGGHSPSILLSVQRAFFPR